MRNFEFFAPGSLKEAIELLSDPTSAARPLAGGTDLVPQMKEGSTRFPIPSRLVSLHRIPDLRGIEADGGLRVGAATTVWEIARSESVRRGFRALAEGASLIGSVQTMHMATVGGNLCNAAPSADTAPPLLALDAEAVIAGPTGTRRLPLQEFFKGPGLTALQHSEILLELRIPPPPPGTGTAYRRQTPRARMDIAVAGVAIALTIEGTRIARARVALGAVGPVPMRAHGAEAALEGQEASDETFARAAATAAGECAPIDDQRGSAAYRRHLVRVLTERLLRESLARASGRS